MASAHKNGLIRRWFRWVERLAVLIHVADIVLSLAGLSIVGGIFYLIKAARQHNTFQAVFSLALSVAAVAFLLLARYLLTQRHVPETQNPHVIEEDRVITFRVGKKRYQEEAKLTLRALHPDVHHYWIQFHWTGSGPVYLTPDSSDVSIVGPISTAASMLTHYLVTFATPLPCNGTRNLRLDYVLEDENLRAQPFVSVLALPNRKRFTLKVVFPNEGNLPTVQLIQQRGRSGRVGGDPVPYAFQEGSRTALWEISRPKLGRNYAITWSADYARNLPDPQ